MLNEYKCIFIINSEVYFLNDCYIVYENGFYEGIYINDKVYVKWNRSFGIY